LTHVARLINEATLTLDDGAYLTRQQLEILYDVSSSCSSSGNYVYVMIEEVGWEIPFLAFTFVLKQGHLPKFKII